MRLVAVSRSSQPFTNCAKEMECSAAKPASRWLPCAIGLRTFHQALKSLSKKSQSQMCIALVSAQSLSTATVFLVRLIVVVLSLAALSDRSLFSDRSANVTASALASTCHTTCGCVSKSIDQSSAGQRKAHLI